MVLSFAFCLQAGDANLDDQLIDAVWANDCPRVAELLAAGADIECRDHEMRTPLMIAAITNRDNIVTSLRDAGANMHAMDCSTCTPAIILDFHA